MRVSQFIYTACGKDRNGAFSVFSKSGDITPEEAAEIREVMIYKAPSGLPNDPTPEQIEELFPKKFGYFFLSSGRVCIAQVCYVGRVYSDLDGRPGNYIIHAFVFDKTNDFAPYSFIEHALFKRMLTRKEWHDDPIPDELPKIEIPESGDMLSSSELSAFFNEDRKIKLKLLVEAIVRSSSENSVCFKDDHKNLKYWFKILSVCLPKAIQNSVSFCSNFTNTLVPGNVSTRVQVRINQPENSLFNYQQEADKGRYVFDFSKNIFPGNVMPGKYSETIVSLISQGVFSAVKFADDINNIMTACSVTINEASALLNIYGSNYSVFDSAEEVLDAISIADRTGYETQTIADNIFKKEPPFNFNAEQKVNLCAFMHKHISAVDIKVGIVKKIIENAEAYGMRADGALAFRDSLNLKAKFIFDNYLDYLKSEGLSAYVDRNKDSFPKLFLVFDSLVNLPDVKKSFKAGNSGGSEETKAVRKIMEFAFMRESVSDIDVLVNAANSGIKDLGPYLLHSVIQSKISSGSYVPNVKFAFDILKILRQKIDYACAYLIKLIEIASKQEEFVKAYINAQNNDPDFYSAFEEQYKEESLMKDFCGKKDALRFADQQLSPKVIKTYFDKYYVTGRDTGLLQKRLNEYLFKVQPEKRIDECNNMLDLLKFPESSDKKLLSAVYVVILNAIFSAPYDKIDASSVKEVWVKKIYEFYKAVENPGAVLKKEVLDLIMVMSSGRILKNYGSPKETQVFSFFKESQADAKNFEKYLNTVSLNESFDIFVDFYFRYVADLLIVGATGAEQFNYDDVVKKAFGKIIEKGDAKKITDIIVNAIKKTKTNASAFVLYIFRKLLAHSGNIFDKNFGKIAEFYFEKLSSGERKKVFAELLTLAGKAEVEQFERYFDEFNKEHKGGFFGFFKRK